MKIGVKIGVGFGGMIALLICVGLVGIWSLQRTIDGYGDEVMTKVYHGRKIAEIPVLIMHAHRYEQDYINTSNNAYAREVNDHLDIAVYAVEQMESAITNTQSLGQLAQVKKRIAEYRREFTALSRTIDTRGASEHMGLRGELREAALQIEEYFAAPQNGIDGGHVLYQTLRRHEQDYGGALQTLIPWTGRYV